MSEQFTLSSPFLNFTFNQIPKHWKAILVGWVALWGAITLGLLYLFAVVLPAYVGFETAVLVGIGILVLAQSQGE